MGKFENEILDLIDKTIEMKSIRQKTFEWLKNDHTLIEYIDVKEFLDKIFIKLNGDIEGLRVKGKRELRVDAFYSEINVVIEIDELQHFTNYRMDTLNLIKEYEYKNLGFDIEKYSEYCKICYEKAIKKGQVGYRKQTKDFPQEFGRCMQRAYFDTIRDLIIPKHSNKPIIRFSEFELKNKNEEELQKYVKTRLSKYL